MIRTLARTLLHLFVSLPLAVGKALRPLRYFLYKELPRRQKKWQSRNSAGAPQQFDLPLDPRTVQQILASPAGKALLSGDAPTGKPHASLSRTATGGSLLAIRFDAPRRRFNSDILFLLSGTYLEEARIQRARIMVRKINFLAWSEGREPQSFPSLDPWNFRMPPSASLLAKSVYDRLHETGLLEPGPSGMPSCRFTHGMSGIFSLPSMHRMRRVLILPLEANREEASRILPPPFRMPPGEITVELHLVIGLAGGFQDPSGEYLPHLGGEKGVLLQLLMPAALMDRKGERHGWIPIYSVVSRRERSRFRTIRGSRYLLYSVHSRSMELELQDENGKICFREAYAPLRAFDRRDPLPGFLTDTGRLFLQEGENLDICVLEEEAVYPANHLHILRRTQLPERQSPPGIGTKRIPPHVAGPGDSASFFSNMLGIQLTTTGKALFTSRLDYEYRSLERSPFLETIFRVPPARTGSLPGAIPRRNMDT